MHCRTILLGVSFFAFSSLTTFGRTIEQTAFRIESGDPNLQSHQSKSIAIVGAGSAGLAALKTLLDLPQNVRPGWEVVLFEERQNVGGIWLPDPNDPHPPDIPETPLYPDLKTNTPAPTMTYPHFPFRPLTPIFPSHEHIEQYHVDYANHFKLSPYLHFNTSILSAAWVGNTSFGSWNITVEDKLTGSRSHRLFDHLIAANGHNRYPYVPTWPGQESWLQGKKGREIIHAVFWRNGTKYEGKSVLVVGGNASGRDVVIHTQPVAEKVYLSLKDGNAPRRLPVPCAIKPAISHFTADSIIFTDGTQVSDIDAVILGTGYEVRVPFLSAGDALAISPGAYSNASEGDPAPEHLTTNLRYVYPLHEHIFSLAASYPPTALAFVGLPVLTANCPSDIAQALLIAHALVDPTLLPSREDMLTQLRKREAHFRERGFDPYREGHRLIDVEGGQRDASHEYQDALIHFLKKRGALPDDGQPFVEQWRRRSRNESEALWRAWERVESLGKEEIERWLKGVRTENEWAGVMDRLIEWEKKQGN
ncbi:FAD/NAD-binding domain-containing protein [Phellopilus nigrolimitatus]|nr:FAD/NAD-binding domain-containing protein [Phellopilus nigrolimitatus]